MMTGTVAIAPALAEVVVRTQQPRCAAASTAGAPPGAASARELCGAVRCSGGDCAGLAFRSSWSSLEGGRSAGSNRPRQVKLAAAKGGGDSKGFPWFRFGKSGMDSEGAGIYGSQKREDFDRDDVEQYFNYMGMLATEGTYDKMEALLNTGIQAVDILLLMAASEGDKPKIEELLRAGADYRVKDDQGRNALDRAQDEEIRELILNESNVQV